MYWPRETYSGGALAVVATQGIIEGAVLVTIPKTAILSVENTSLAPFLEKNRIGGGLGLVLACMHEVALGPKSPWYVLAGKSVRTVKLVVFVEEMRVVCIRSVHHLTCTQVCLPPVATHA